MSRINDHTHLRKHAAFLKVRNCGGCEDQLLAVNLVNVEGYEGSVAFYQEPYIDREDDNPNFSFDKLDPDQEFYVTDYSFCIKVKPKDIQAVLEKIGYSNPTPPVIEPVPYNADDDDGETDIDVGEAIAEHIKAEEADDPMDVGGDQ